MRGSGATTPYMLEKSTILPKPFGFMCPANSRQRTNAGASVRSNVLLKHSASISSSFFPDDEAKARCATPSGTPYSKTISRTNSGNPSTLLKSKSRPTVFLRLWLSTKAAARPNISKQSTLAPAASSAWVIAEPK